MHTYTYMCVCVFLGLIRRSTQTSNGMYLKISQHSKPNVGKNVAHSSLTLSHGRQKCRFNFFLSLCVSLRYALICQQCFSHNGMALKEEFEYLGTSQTHLNVY